MTWATAFPPNLRLVSSNQRKLAEFRELGLPMAVAIGQDLPEVDGTPDEVILHKSVAAGAGTLIEDTVLEIDGVPVVDIRWRLGGLDRSEGSRAAFVVSLAMNDGNTVRVWRGRTEGVLRSPETIPPGTFGFDPFFLPDGADGLTLHDLVLQGRKTAFSARARAVTFLLTEPPLTECPLEAVETWTGSWQGKTP
jgi:inosine/xanthosine triphosphate pyrophosphatase family protein